MTVGRALLAGISLAALTAPAFAETEIGEDIIVTAERTQRTLRDTATSVSVLTADQVDRLGGAYGTNDVIERIPNLVSTRPSSSAPAIRGLDGTGPAIGGAAFIAGTRPRVNYQVDNRTLSYNETIYIDGTLWDLQQIEVYRGPQSTLQGRNAIGGVIAIKTADPTNDWQVKARAVGGEYDTVQLSGAAGGPIIPDILAFRVAADWRSEQNYIDFAPYITGPVGTTAARTIDNPSRSESLMLRGKLLFTPSPDARALITLTHNDAYAPQAGDLVRPYQNHNPSTPLMPRFHNRSDTIIADMDYRLADGLTLAFLGTASDFRILRYSPPAFGNAQIDGREYTAEPRLRFGTAESRLSGFIAGLIYRARQTEAIDLIGGLNFRDRTNTNALFGELAFKATPSFDVTLGARYEEEHRIRNGGGAAPFTVDLDRTFRAFLPRITLAYKATSEVTVGATVGRGYNAGGAGFSFDPPIQNYVFDKETVTNYEGFVRATLADGRLDLRGNVFFNDYDGLQLSIDVNPDPAIFSYRIDNVDRATTYGLEVESRFEPIKALTLFANAGLLKTKINRSIDPLITGRELARSPAFTFNTGFQFRPVQPVELSFDIRYTDTYYSDNFNDARGKTDPYFVGNAQISWKPGPARFFVAATNLFDTTDVVSLTPGATRDGDVGVITRPRRVTGGVELSF